MAVVPCPVHLVLGVLVTMHAQQVQTVIELRAVMTTEYSSDRIRPKAAREHV